MTSRPCITNPSRRQLLRRGLVATGVIAAGPALWGQGGHAASPRSALPGGSSGRTSNIPNLAGTLHEVTVENDLHTRVLLPRGFSIREVARTGQRPVAGSDYIWHQDPDGGATFATDDGGWIYVSNAEVGERSHGGVGALRFDAAGQLVDAYPICAGTTNNCAGGPTPWGTWLTCEEIDAGIVYECDPLGRQAAVPCPAMGVFKHEAAAVDPIRGHIYLTEDTPDGNFYRFTPDFYPAGGRPDLSSGVLEVAIVDGDDPFSSRSMRWEAVNEAQPENDRLVLDDGATATRHQVEGAAKFAGGEGCWYHDGIVYFTTKHDNRVWAVDCGAQRIDLIYDKQSQQAFNPGIDDVDNVTVSSGGDVLVAEDGAEMRIVVVGPDLTPFELVNVQGHRGSEICGPAFSPDGSRLYFSSQNGAEGNSLDGRIYEMRGPFFV